MTFLKPGGAIEYLCVRKAAEKITDKDIEVFEKINLEFLDAMKDPSIMFDTNLKFHVLCDNYPVRTK
ncbi:hypothetical protein [Desulfobacula sp.]|uniref:hypothetical protein n=1 Tax=Desulfobacula sp. TaxID=2593537 RepID=UPI002613EC01|nr:hypothetical protein [Desulfobacula sp.]